MMGLYRKYKVLRADGSEFPPGESFFVLSVSADMHARYALKAYGDSVRAANLRLSNDIDVWLREIMNKEERRRYFLPYWQLFVMGGVIGFLIGMIFTIAGSLIFNVVP